MPTKRKLTTNLFALMMFRLISLYMGSLLSRIYATIYDRVFPRFPRPVNWIPVQESHPFCRVGKSKGSALPDTPNTSWTVLHGVGAKMAIVFCQNNQNIRPSDLWWPGSLSHDSKYGPSLSKALGPVDPSFLIVNKSHLNKNIHPTASLRTPQNRKYMLVVNTVKHVLSSHSKKIKQRS